ncbi:polyprotein [Brevicoryne brassicae virus - UK]|uniref:Genome polyprotein n=1 Tax=Brevicoryne brassicae virus TaxID=1993638 RepID=A5A104_9VIRU|nr:polyprotein [Brevicoryne brassicae virus - UK]ABP57198.1 polyprotein [Brevicoryne brassicae virus - UK]
MMSVQNKNFVVSSSTTASPSCSTGSSEDYSSEIGSTNVGTCYQHIDSLGYQYARCAEKIEKYESRKIDLLKILKDLRAKEAQLNIVPPPTVPKSIPVPKSIVNPCKLDNRSYSEVASIPISSSEEELIFNYPIAYSNKLRINKLQKQYDLNEWRIKKQLKRRTKLNKLMLNQVQYSPIYNYHIDNTNNSVYNPTTVPIPDSYQPFPARPTSSKHIKIRKDRNSINDSIFGLYIPTPIATRDPILSIKLRCIIRSFRNVVNSSYIKFLIFHKYRLLPSYKSTPPPIVCYPQMDAHGEDSNNIGPDKKLNTVVSSQRDTSEGVSNKVVYPAWQDLVSSDHYSSYPTSISRWTKYKTIQWLSTGMSNSSISVPSDLLTEFVNTPVFIPFRNNRLWRGDLEFKFVLNSNKFQQGSLQVSFIYCASLEQSFNVYRDNVYSASQTNHCILNAGSSNEGILKIPFKYYNPVITTNPKENVDYCKIFIRVLNVLRCTSTTYGACDLTIFVNFDNAYFTGSIDFSLIQNPQMFHLMRALVKTAEFGLNQLDPDANRDNPPDISTPSPVVISNASSWCVGNTAVDQLNHLRLVSTGQTPHPNLEHDELKTNVISRIFGLVKTLDWSFNHQVGHLLFNLEAAPMGALTQYYSSSVTVANRDYLLYNFPPVTILSNLYAYWRGTLELRLDFVATSFHTGSLLIAYIPGIKSNVTLDQARSSNYVVCSLQEQQSYTVRIPYIANSPCWPRKYNKSYKIKIVVEINPPGSLQIFVLNPLIPLDSVHSSIEINCYLRAGVDFELLVPIQPNISTPYNLDYKDAQYNELPLSNADLVEKKTTIYYCCSSPINYPGMITLTSSDPSSNNLIMYESLRDGSYINNKKRITDLNNYVPNVPGIFNFYLSSSLSVTFKYQQKSSTSNFITSNCKFFVLYNELCSSEGTTTLWVVRDEEAAKRYARSEQSWDDLMKAVINCVGISDTHSDTNAFTYLTKIFVHKHTTNLCSSLSSSYSDITVPNNEERSLSTNFLDMTQNLQSTSHGLNLFGEDFSDLKDYCRRYQYYTNINCKLSSSYIKKQAVAVIPLVPQGLINSVIYPDHSINHIVNRCKDGFIPIISSGYRFFRGGLRFRIVCDSRRNVNLWVQHRPEMLLKYLQPHMTDIDNQSLSDYFNHSYSFNIQNLSLNNVVSLEVPWYSKNMLGCSFFPKVISSDTDINSQNLTSFSLGSLILGLDYDKTETTNPLNLDIYYSLADDFHFNTFQGFPLMLTLEQIPNTYALPQMGIFNKLISDTPTAKKVDMVTEKAEKLIDNISDCFSALPNLIESNFNNVETCFKVVLHDIFYGILHCIVSPCVKTFCLVICSIFTKVGVLAVEGIWKLAKLLKRFYKFFIGAVSEDAQQTDDQPSTSKVLPQADTQDEDPSSICAGIVSIIWAGVNTMLNVTFKSCESLGDCANMLMSGITKGANHANTMFRFVKNIFGVLEKMYKSVINKIFAKYDKYNRLKVEEETLREWLDLCDNLLSPANSTLVQNDIQWREAVYCAARYGHIYLSKQKAGATPRVDMYIRKVYDKIINLRDSLQKEKLFPSLRMEAYGLWLDGKPGIGKSSMITKLSTDLLNSINYKSDSGLIFNVTPLDKYWSTCDHQPVLTIDDAFAIQTPECIQNQLWAYFSVMSPVPLIPPMAEIKDKKNHYNPEIMITCSNNAFPRLPGIAEPKALYRRRHQLIRVQLKKPECPNYPFGFTVEEVNELKHLEFAVATDVRVEGTYKGAYSYNELIKMLIKDFHKFKERSAAAYEERKRLQFSMLTDSQAKKLPETKKISEYLKEIDTKHQEEIAKQKLDFATVEETVKAIDEIQSHADFSLRWRADTSLLLPGAKTVEENAAVVDEKAAQVSDPESDTGGAVVFEVPDTLTNEQLIAAFDPLTPEELAEFDRSRQDMREMENETNRKIKEVIKKSKLMEFEDKIGQDISRTVPERIQFLCKFSSFASYILRMGTADNAPSSNAQNNFLLALRVYNNNVPCKDKINMLGDICSKRCVHYLIKYCTSYRIERKFGLRYPVWEVPIKYDPISQEFVYSKYSNQILNVSDFLCSDPNCIVNRPSEWLKLVSQWLSWGLKYAPWCAYSKDCPVVSCAVSKISKFRKFINAIQYAIVSTVKFCLYDVFYNSIHWLGTVFITVGGFLSGLAGILGLVGLFKVPRPQLVSSGDTVTKAGTANVRKIIFGQFNPGPQSSVSNNNLELISSVYNRINRNTVYINYEDKVLNKISHMKCIVIKERYVIVLRHYIEYLECNATDTSNVNITWADCGSYPFNYKDYKIYWCENSNIGVLRLGNWFSARRSLIPFITKSDSFLGNAGRECVILDVKLSESYVYNENIKLVDNVTIAPTSYSKMLIMPNAYMYKKNYPGMCGSVLMNEATNTPILGIHVAGANGKGFSEPICRAQFDSLFQHIEKGIVEDVIPTDWRELETRFIPVDQRKLFLSGTHTYLGNIDPNIAKYEAGVSSIVPSTIQGVFPIGTEPGPLTPRDPRINGEFSPLLTGCEKHCNPTIDFNKEDLAYAESDLSSLIIANCKPIRVSCHALTELQAVNGIPDLEGYQSMTWNTSEGFYLSRLRPKNAHDKRWLFNFDKNGQVVSLHPYLREILDIKMSDRLSGIVPATVHDDCLKDARLPLSKIKIPGKVRVFSISPVDFTIQFRQYFLDFIASYTKARFNCEHAIGINVHGYEWSELAHFFEGKKLITGDYSGFGPSLNSEVVTAAFRIICKWYKQYGCSVEDNHIRMMMSKELINAKHLMRDYLYEVQCGLPSGNPATVIFNSIVNSIYIRCAWLDVMRNSSYKSLLDFRNNIKLITYGDDLIASIDNSVSDKFNNNSLSHFFLKHNIKFTDAAKTGVNVEPYIYLETATFLKHAFKPHPIRQGVYLAQLEELSITECANWIRKSPDPKTATYDNCVQGTMLAYGHGPDYYNRYVKKISEAWFEKYEEEFVVRTWSELDHLFLVEGMFIDW